MKLILTFLFMSATIVNCQDLYIKTFGDSLAQPIIFLHGGPGYNAANFEITTASVLAKAGYFVIVYDRRGEGRSNDKEALFTFGQTFNDLINIYNQFHLKSATLIGHSFGGVVATLFANAHAEKVKSIILVGAPISLQATLKNIIFRSKELYNHRKDSVNLKYISMLENMDTSSIQYSSFAFQHAMQNGFYSPKDPRDAAKALYASFKTDSVLKKYAGKMTFQAPQGFWKNEKYTTINLYDSIELLKKKIKFYGLYGKDDGLYSQEQVGQLQQQLGKSQVKYIDNCSHNVFIDQQELFVRQIKVWLN